MPHQVRWRNTMERNNRAIIIYAANGLLGLAGIGLFAYITLVGLAMPTATDYFNNKLLLCSIVILFIGWKGLMLFFKLTTTNLKKAHHHWKLKKLRDKRVNYEN